MRLKTVDQNSRGGGAVDLDIDEKLDEGDEATKIVCATCGHELTRVAARTAVDGSHRHAKVNPHGHVYHIACFQPVPGILPVGKPSPEFTWFSGYRWQIALCGGCQIHLGWQFSGDGDFGALIEGRFAEDDSSE